MGWWVGGPGHYVVTPTRVEVELGCDNYCSQDARSLGRAKSYLKLCIISKTPFISDMH